MAIYVPNQPKLCDCGAGAAHSNAFVSFLTTATASSTSPQESISPKAGKEMPNTRADTEQVTRAVPAALTKEGFGQGQGQEICSSHQLVLRLQARAQKRGVHAQQMSPIIES